MQKHQIRNFVFDSLQTSPFDGPKHLRENINPRFYSITFVQAKFDITSVLLFVGGKVSEIF
jgi:hypothetical protein